MRTGIAALRDQDFKSQYRDYLNRLDARAVLDHYGAEHSYDLVNAKDGSTEVIHSCLLDTVERHHAHGDQNPSAACNLDKKLYVCYSYWGGDLIHFIMKMEGKDTPEEVAGIVNDFLTGTTKEEDVFAAEIAKMMEAAPAGAYTDELPSYSEKILAPWAFVHPYLTERGIDAATASHLDIGWDETDNRITIPHFWDGKLVGWQKRAIPPRPGQWPGTEPQIPKYRSTSGFPKSQTLYGWDLLSDAQRQEHLIVVESPFSVIKAHALGVPGVVATFGAKVSDAQIKLLTAARRVTVWMDDDTAGRMAERKLVRGLFRSVDILDVVEPAPKTDLGDYAEARQVEACLKMAAPAIYRLSEWDRGRS